MAVKGHLPPSETTRAAGIFRAQPAGMLRVLVMHQNLLRGNISARMGLARWGRAWRGVIESGADLVLCGHDHEEAAGQLPNGAVVATSGTHTRRTRGGRPSACNVVHVNADTITVQHHSWNPDSRRFAMDREQAFPRPRVDHARD